jgi:hypothetical protein
VPTELTRETHEAEEVFRWRRRQLTDAGFGHPLASRLARDLRWDLHALLELVERGCPPGAAARIIAPLDGNEAA